MFLNTSYLLPALGRTARACGYGLGKGVGLRPAVRGFRATAALGSRQSSGNLSDADGFSTQGRHVIGALVVNESGVLAGVATLLAGRGFNIDSLVVGRTEIPELSRMTIVVNGDDQALTNVRASTAAARGMRTRKFLAAGPAHGLTAASSPARRSTSSCRT